MNDTARHVAARGLAAGSAALLLVAGLFGCAGVGGASSTARPASLAGGKVTPALPPAANYGADPSRQCASSHIAESVQETANDEAKKARKPAPKADGRLCAVAESLLSWDEKQPVPEPLLAFLGQYFGVVQPITRAIVNQLPPQKEQDVVDPIVEVLGDYIASASNVSYGLAILRSREGPMDRGARATGIEQPMSTKVVLVMQEPTLELDPLARKLDPAAQATVKGRVLGNLQNAKVLISDTSGKLQQPPEQKSKEFSAPIACEGRTGRMALEIRAEDQGSPKVMADLPVLCGITPPDSADLPTAQAVDPAQQERALFDRINQERTAAGLPALAWDDKVAQVARAASQSEAKAASGGGGGVSGQELAQRLKEAGVSSAVVLQNPGQGRTPTVVHNRFEVSPVHRSNYMSTDATQGAVGVATFVRQGEPSVVVNEIFIRQLGPVDLASLRPKLRQAINKSRTGAGSAPFGDDPTLDKVADEYAKELAAAGGNISNTRHSGLVSPLYRSFRTVDLLSGAPAEPMQIADEKSVLTSKEKLMGIGLAQGKHPSLGDNAVYVVLVFGTKK